MIEGASLFDIGIFLGVLFAMLLTSMPQKFAMSICLSVALLGILINSLAQLEYITVRAVFPLAGIAEVAAAFMLIMYGRIVWNRRDQVFFYLMAGFLLFSSAINLIFIPVYLYTDYLTFGMYQAAFHTIAVLHVLTMLGYSDGIRALFRDIRDSFFRDHADTSHS